MARRIIDRNTYDLLLTAYRDTPGNHTNAARVAGIDRRMARRAFETGWDSAPWAVPIKSALQSEQIAARAERAKMRTAEFIDEQTQRDNARRDAIDARATELHGLKMARGVSIATFNALLRVMRDIQPVAERVRAMADDLDNVSPERALNILDRVARLANTATNTAQTVMRMERLHAGDPETVVAVQLGELSDDDITAELNEINAALQIAGRADDSQIIDAVTVDD